MRVFQNRAVTTPARRAILCALALAALCACVWTWGGAAPAASAQSGRRSTKPISPVPTPTPEPTPEGESESISRGRPKSQSTALLTLAVYEDEDAFSYVTRDVSDVVMEAFLARLTASPSVSAARGGGGRVSRKEAQRQAKNEKETYVLVLQLAEDVSPGRESVGRADTRLLAIKLSVYEPVTGSLKYTDTIWQRPYRETTTIGGVRLPVPTRTRRIERFPNELELEQAAREAADRTMSRFNITLPPDN